MYDHQPSNGSGHGLGYLKRGLVTAICQASMLLWNGLHRENLEDALGHVHGTLTEKIQYGGQGEETCQANCDHQRDAYQPSPDHCIHLANAYGQPGNCQCEQRSDRVRATIDESKERRGSSQVLHKEKIEIGNEESGSQPYEYLHHDKQKKWAD